MINIKEKIESGEFIKQVFGTRKAMYDGAEVRRLLETAVDVCSLTSKPIEPTRKITIKRVRKGDVFIGMSINHKFRPFVVAKAGKECSYCIPLTSEENCYSTIAHSSRYLEEGYYSNHMVKVDNEFIIANFKFPLGNNKTLNQAIQIITKNLTKDFNYVIRSKSLCRKAE